MYREHLMGIVAIIIILIVTSILTYRLHNRNEKLKVWIFSFMCVCSILIVLFS